MRTEKQRYNTHCCQK